MLIHNQSLKNLNTFGVESKAKLFAELFSEEELVELLCDENIKLEKKLILGGGSNILFTEDFDGLVIKVSIPKINVIEENDESVLIEAGAGVIWDELVKHCVEKNYGGIENLTFIPGTVGAAPIQNIGAYGQELSDTFHSLDGVYTETCEKKKFRKSECRFSYRSSIFKEGLKNNFIITLVRLNLSKNQKPNTVYKTLQEYLSKKEITNPSLKDISKSVEEIRRQRLPDPTKIGNAGSFFKNPEVSKDVFIKLKSEFDDVISFATDSEKIKISAGWLIEKCGWKGKRIGDVGTSPDHALVICNYGKATGAEIVNFALRIKEEVANKFGITLEEEVNIF